MQEFAEAFRHNYSQSLSALTMMAYLLRRQKPDDTDITYIATLLDAATDELKDQLENVYHVYRVSLSLLVDSDASLVLLDCVEKVIAELAPQADARGVTVELAGSSRARGRTNRSAFELVARCALSQAIGRAGHGGHIEMSTRPRGRFIDVTVSETPCPLQSVGVPSIGNSAFTKTLSTTDNTIQAAASIVDLLAQRLGHPIIIRSDGETTKLTIRVPRAPEEAS